jgi:translation elongation factor EF-1alpha
LKEHLLLCRVLGIGAVLVVINQLDRIAGSHEQKTRYDSIVDQLQSYLMKIGYREDQVRFVPCSALKDINIKPMLPVDHDKQKEKEKKSSHASSSSSPSEEAAVKWDWYAGPTVCEAINSLPLPTRPSVDAPLRAIVHESYPVGSQRVLCHVRIDQGRLTQGDSVFIRYPRTTMAKCLALSSNNAQNAVSAYGSSSSKQHRSFQPTAVSGDVATVTLDVKDDEIVVGSVLCAMDRGLWCPLASTFRAQLRTFTAQVLTRGVSAIAYVGALGLPVRIIRMLGEDRAVAREGAMVELVMETVDRSAVPVEVYKACKGLGRVALRVGQDTVAGGIIVEVGSAAIPAAAAASSSS